MSFNELQWLLRRRAFAESFVSMPAFGYFGGAVCVALVAAIPVLFAIGERLTAQRK